MVRLFLSALLATSAVAAPALWRIEPGLHFPTKVGARWVYERGGADEVVEVSAVE